DHGERRPPAQLDRLVTGRVETRDVPVVGGFVQERSFTDRVTREQDRRRTDPHRSPVDLRQAVLVELDSEGLEPQTVDVRSTAHRHDDFIDGEALARPTDLDATPGFGELDL